MIIAWPYRGSVSSFGAVVARTGGQAPAWVEAELLARWSEPQRHYHTVAHLRAVLDTTDHFSAYAESPDLVRLALWFHDAIYDPTAYADANEQASAILAARHLSRCGVPVAGIAEVVRLVRLTAGHAVDPADRNGSLLADADLAVLARPWPSYVEYTAQIRAEYAHVPDELFRAGRAQVLRGLLGLPVLYRIPELRDRWEDAARTNVGREIEQLTGSGA